MKTSTLLSLFNSTLADSAAKLMKEGKTEEALPFVRLHVAYIEALMGEYDPLTLSARNCLATILRGAGLHEEASKEYERILDVLYQRVPCPAPAYEALMKSIHCPDPILVLADYADLLEENGCYDAANANRSTIIRHFKELIGLPYMRVVAQLCGNPVRVMKN